MGVLRWCCLAPFGNTNGCYSSDMIRIKWSHIRSQLVWSLTPPLIFQAFLLHLLYNLFIHSLATKESQECLQFYASYFSILDNYTALVSPESFKTTCDESKFLCFLKLKGSYHLEINIWKGTRPIWIKLLCDYVEKNLLKIF